MRESSGEFGCEESFKVTWKGEGREGVRAGKSVARISTVNERAGCEAPFAALDARVVVFVLVWFGDEPRMALTRFGEITSGVVLDLARKAGGFSTSASF